jgi:acyl carrier protein
MNSTIREILARYGNLTVAIGTLSDSDELVRAGLASHATVNIMLAIEDELRVEFSDELMSRATFATIGSIEAAVKSLQPVQS